MNRKDALIMAKIAGYHEDIKGGTRILIESRISRAAYDYAFESGRAAKRNGVTCGCPSCKNS